MNMDYCIIKPLTQRVTDMTEYDVKKALHKRGGQVNSEASAAQSVNGIPNSVLADVFAGKRGASDEMLGHRAALAPSIAAKMSRSFGMDVSAVQVYRSDAMAGTEMQGMAQGNKVVLSSDVDLNTLEGQATLGHELSHIRAQSMGMGSGRGLLQNGALERQADTEGMLAARGMSIGGESMGMSMGLGMAGMEGLTPLGGGLSASAAAPMQAAKGDKKEALSLQETEEMQSEYDQTTPGGDFEDVLDSLPWLKGDDDYTTDDYHGICDFYFEPAKEKLANDVGEERHARLTEKLKGVPGDFLTFSPIDGKERMINGLVPGRIACSFRDFWAGDHSDDEIVQLFHELTAGSTEIDKDGKIVPIEGGDPLDPKYDEAKMRGANRYKNILYWKLKQIESEFGTILTQLHPRDVVKRMGAKKLLYYAQIMQDAQQLVDNNDKPETKQLMAQGSDNPGRDAEMKKLLKYYNLLFAGLKQYPMHDELGFGGAITAIMSAKGNESGIGGPCMDQDQLRRYNQQTRKKIDSGEYEERPEILYIQIQRENERWRKLIKH